MTFDKAYCNELNANITAYKARREFFAQKDNTLRFKFLCPDEDCNIELVGVNIYTIGKTKQKAHFRTKPKCSHSENCSIINEEENKKIASKNSNHSETHNGVKSSIYPDEFILERTRSENKNKTLQDSDDDELDVESRQNKESTTLTSNEAKPHKTSYLENIVDSYEDMKEQKNKEEYITLNKQRRTYYSTFKKIQYFEDGYNFIFYGDIEPIKVYGNNYSIKFKKKVWIDKKSYQISIYITNEIIGNYRLSRLFKESIEALVTLEDKFKKARCYFVGSYPKIKEVSLKGGKSYYVYDVLIENLDHLVIKFTE